MNALIGLAAFAATIGILILIPVALEAGYSWVRGE